MATFNSEPNSKSVDVAAQAAQNVDRAAAAEAAVSAFSNTPVTSTRARPDVMAIANSLTYVEETMTSAQITDLLKSQVRAVYDLYAMREAKPDLSYPGLVAGVFFSEEVPRAVYVQAIGGVMSEHKLFISTEVQVPFYATEEFPPDHLATFLRIGKANPSGCALYTDEGLYEMFDSWGVPALLPGQETKLFQTTNVIISKTPKLTIAMMADFVLRVVVKMCLLGQRIPVAKKGHESTAGRITGTVLPIRLHDPAVLRLFPEYEHVSVDSPLRAPNDYGRLGVINGNIVAGHGKIGEWVDVICDHITAGSVVETFNRLQAARVEPDQLVRDANNLAAFIKRSYVVSEVMFNMAPIFLPQLENLEEYVAMSSILPALVKTVLSMMSSLAGRLALSQRQSTIKIQEGLAAHGPQSVTNASIATTVVRFLGSLDIDFPAMIAAMSAMSGVVELTDIYCGRSLRLTQQYVAETHPSPDAIVRFVAAMIMQHYFPELYPASHAYNLWAHVTEIAAARWNEYSGTNNVPAPIPARAIDHETAPPPMRTIRMFGALYAYLRGAAGGRRVRRAGKSAAPPQVYMSAEADEYYEAYPPLELNEVPRVRRSLTPRP